MGACSVWVFVASPAEEMPLPVLMVPVGGGVFVVDGGVVQVQEQHQALSLDLALPGVMSTLSARSVTSPDSYE